MKTYLLTFIHIFQIENNEYASIMLQVISKQSLLSGVPQGSIVGPILFNCFFNDFFYFIEKASVHNFADDNTLGMLEETIQNLIALLENESNTDIEWFHNNKMMVKPTLVDLQQITSML